MFHIRSAVCLLLALWTLPAAGGEADQIASSPAATAAKLWSLQPIGNPPPPQIRRDDWPRSAIDRFVLARLEREGLAPVADARPAALLRRVYFDLIGLPPPLREIDAFLDDPSPKAYDRLVDRLLASPQFGERWGRHWLDVARYAESNGKSRDVLMPHAWRYRDYVIDAVNADVPYDRFITEQIAGDLLAGGPDSRSARDAEQRDRLKIATGFLAIGAKTLVGGTQQMDLIDEQIDASTRAVLGLTVACARCHDHKFDPIPTRDYYALAGIFLSTDTRFGGGLRRAKDAVGRAKELIALGPDADETVKQIREHQTQTARLQKQRQTLQKKLKQLKKKLPKKWQEQLRSLKVARARAARKAEDGDESAGESAGESADLVPDGIDKRVVNYASVQDDFRQVQSKLRELEERDVPELKFAVGVSEAGNVRDCRIHVRGERSSLGESVPRGFLSCIELKDAPEVDRKQSGRLALARWLTHPDNPLTARVAVNRTWMHLFGRGIVATVDNFGANGEKPTHPALLDRLARRFIENGWSRKKLIRKIVLSRTYRLSTDYDEENHAADPGNRLLWRMSRRRLQAEALRDAMLAVSGRLKLDRPHGSAVARIGEGEVGRGINTKLLSKPFPHRSVYLPIIRGIIPPQLKVFDFPEPSNVQGERDTTNVPAQSLYLMNNPFVIEQAEALAERVVQASPEADERIETLFKLCYARRPTASELTEIQEFLSESRARSKRSADDADRESWTTIAHAVLASAEFRYTE